MSKSNGVTYSNKHWIIAMLLSFILVFGLIGIVQYIGFLFNTLDKGHFLLLISLSIALGLFFDELYSHQLTKKELSKIKSKEPKMEKQHVD